MTRLWRCRRAQALAEYGVVLLVVGVGVASTSALLDKHVTPLWTAANQVLAAASQNSASTTTTGATTSFTALSSHGEATSFHQMTWQTRVVDEPEVAVEIRPDRRRRQSDADLPPPIVAEASR